MNPHSHTLRKTWARDEVFAWVVATNLRYGYPGKFGRRWYGQIDIDGYLY
jgi:hypothetical protein